MQADFLDAHERHWTDAETLLRAERWANADHLYGMTAECGLKRLMLAFGMKVNPSTGSPVDGKDWKHANGIWARFESYRCGHHQGAAYVLPTPDPFTDWDVAQRYAHQSNFGQARVVAHQCGASQVRALVQKARREGLIC